jgi:very-short-patch-repair endonuclease
MAMKIPSIRQKFLASYTPENRIRRAAAATTQMQKCLATDIDKTLWAWKISTSTKEKWKSRPSDEKREIRFQLSKGRETFQKKMEDPEYKNAHVRKILCSGKIVDTKPERQLKTILSSFNLVYQHPFQVDSKVYDFYIPSLNLLIEVDGNYWHGKGLTKQQMNPMQLKHHINDITKTKLAKLRGFNLLRIWEGTVTPSFVMERILQYV